MLVLSLLKDPVLRATPSTSSSFLIWWQAVVRKCLFRFWTIWYHLNSWLLLLPSAYKGRFVSNCDADILICWAWKQWVSMWPNFIISLYIQRNAQYLQLVKLKRIWRWPLTRNWIFHIWPKNQKLSSNHEKEEIQPSTKEKIRPQNRINAWFKQHVGHPHVQQHVWDWPPSITSPLTLSVPSNECRLITKLSHAAGWLKKKKNTKGPWEKRPRTKGKRTEKKSPNKKQKEVQRNKGGRTLRQTLEENTLETNELSKEHY